jgi:hypothetical protein
MASDTPLGDSELAIFSRFSRAFSHVVRGDLSVITNEVSYLATTMPADDLGRVRNRCAQIAATVSKISGLKSEVCPTLLSADDTARLFGAQVRAYSAEMVSLDRVKIERLASILRQMLGDGENRWKGEWSSECGLSLSIEIPKPSGPSANYSSWSSFATRELGERAVIDAVVADLIIRAHGWHLSIKLEGCLMSCRIVIPPHTAIQRDLSYA